MLSKSIASGLTGSNPVSGTIYKEAVLISTDDFRTVVEYMNNHDVNGWVKATGLVDLLLDLTDFSLEEIVSEV